MERHVLVAVVSSHPVPQARLTMDQIVNILEANSPLPSIQDRPLSLLANIGDTEQSLGFSALSYTLQAPNYLLVTVIIPF